MKHNRHDQSSLSRLQGTLEQFHDFHQPYMGKVVAEIWGLTCIFVWLFINISFLECVLSILNTFTLDHHHGRAASDLHWPELKNPIKKYGPYDY